MQVQMDTYFNSRPLGCMLGIVEGGVRETTCEGEQTEVGPY